MSVISTLILFVLTICLVVTGLWAMFTAQRLNRLHIRTDAALMNLQAALDRRAAVVGAKDPRVQEAAREAESASLVHGAFARRAAAERALHSACVAHKISDIESDTKVQLAHRFYNEAVADTRALRLRPAVRFMRLGGTAALPDFFELSN